jgi:DNA-binding response OmpR family regulator
MEAIMAALALERTEVAAPIPATASGGEQASPASPAPADPKKRPKGAVVQTTPAAIPETRLPELTCLIVDDNRFARQLVKNALYTFGMRRTIEAADAIQAFEIIRSDKIDFAIVDMEMPLVTGIEFTLLVRRGERGTSSELPIIMISGYADERRVVEAKNAGVHEFVAKPFSAEDLFRRVRNTLVRPRPFIYCDTYIGPDRRMGNKGELGFDDRRKAPHLAPPVIDMTAHSVDKPRPPRPAEGAPSQIPPSVAPFPGAVPV